MKTPIKFSELKINDLFQWKSKSFKKISDRVGKIMTDSGKPGKEEFIFSLADQVIQSSPVKLAGNYFPPKEKNKTIFILNENASNEVVVNEAELLKNIRLILPQLLEDSLKDEHAFMLEQWTLGMQQHANNDASYRQPFNKIKNLLRCRYYQEVSSLLPSGYVITEINTYIRDELAIINNPIGYLETVTTISTPQQGEMFIISTIKLAD